MAFISRPGKEGNATTYQGKVAAGYTNILAQEVDGDIDAIFSAWNAGVDTVNIKDAAVTAAKLAPGAVTSSALAPGSITNAALAAGSVTSSTIADGTIVAADIAPGTLTDSLIASVAWTKLIAPYIGGLTLTPRAGLVAQPTCVELQANPVGSPGYDNTKASYLLRLDYTGDEFEVWRAPPPGTAWARIFSISAAGLASIYGAAASALTPANFSLTTANTWTRLVTLPNITTRGANVHLFANHTLSVQTPPQGGICNQRWIRDGLVLATRPFYYSSGTAFVALPGIVMLDSAIAAGPHVYGYDVLAGTGCSLQSTPTADGLFQAVEIG